MCVPVCVFVRMCVYVLIPGRTSSEFELLGSSVGVPGVDTGKKQRKRERRKERAEETEGYKRVRGIKGSGTTESHF